MLVSICDPLGSEGRGYVPQFARNDGALRLGPRPASCCAHAEQIKGLTRSGKLKASAPGADVRTTAIVQNRQKNGVYQQVCNHSSVK